MIIITRAPATQKRIWAWASDRLSGLSGRLRLCTEVTISPISAAVTNL